MWDGGQGEKVYNGLLGSVKSFLRLNGLCSHGSYLSFYTPASVLPTTRIHIHTHTELSNESFNRETIISLVKTQPPHWLQCLEILTLLFLF